MCACAGFCFQPPDSGLNDTKCGLNGLNQVNPCQHGTPTQCSSTCTLQAGSAVTRNATIGNTTHAPCHGATGVRASALCCIIVSTSGLSAASLYQPLISLLHHCVDPLLSLLHHCGISLTLARGGMVSSMGKLLQIHKLKISTIQSMEMNHHECRKLCSRSHQTKPCIALLSTSSRLSPPAAMLIFPGQDLMSLAAVSTPLRHACAPQISHGLIMPTMPILQTVLGARGIHDRYANIAMQLLLPSARLRLPPHHRARPQCPAQRMSPQEL